MPNINSFYLSNYDANSCMLCQDIPVDFARIVINNRIIHYSICKKCLVNEARKRLESQPVYIKVYCKFCNMTTDGVGFLGNYYCRNCFLDLCSHFADKL